MYLSPIKALENKWITGEITPEMIQPNGIDFTLDNVYSSSLDTFVLSAGAFKKHRKWVEKDTYEYVGDNGISFKAYHLSPHAPYDVLSNLEVSLPAGVAAFVIGRSTLNRNSIFLTSGLYDSGFNGNIGCQLHNNGPSAVIERGARIGQIVFVAAASAKSYNGQYNNLAKHWSE